MKRQRSVVLLALLGAVAACAPGGSGRGGAGAGAGAGAAPAARGARLFSGNCTACHQADGRGIPGVYPSLAGSPTVLGDPRALALWVTRGQRPATMPAGRYSTVMPQFGWLDAADAAALLTYLRSSFGNHAPPVDEATMARALSAGS